MADETNPYRAPEAPLAEPAPSRLRAVPRWVLGLTVWAVGATLVVMAGMALAGLGYIVFVATEPGKWDDLSVVLRGVHPARFGAGVASTGVAGVYLVVAGGRFARGGWSQALAEVLRAAVALAVAFVALRMA